MNRLVKVWQAGRMSYQRAWNYQKFLAEKHRNAEKSEHADVLMIVEHDPVYTIGIRTKEYASLDVEKLQSLGAEFYKTNRGGLITFHGPGQLVAYPIVNLKHFNPSVRWYVCSLEKTIISLCAKYGIEANTSPHTGVWIGDNKICAIGVHASRYITTHGLALNCNTDLSWFEHIIPCGIPDKGVTTLTKELDRLVSVDSAVPHFLECFGRVFQCNCVAMTASEKDNALSFKIS